jgi:hypothetical protein
MFRRLHTLPGFRGVKRITYASSPNDLRMPSIQPKQSAWSTVSSQVTDALPVAFLY